MRQAFRHLFSFHLASLLISWPTGQLLPFVPPSFPPSLWSVIWLSKHNDLASWGNELWVTPACISQVHLPAVCLETGFIHLTHTHTHGLHFATSQSHTWHRCLEKIYTCFPYQRDKVIYLPLSSREQPCHRWVPLTYTQTDTQTDTEKWLQMCSH